jgi:hypothetical protein
LYFSARLLFKTYFTGFCFAFAETRKRKRRRCDVRKPPQLFPFRQQIVPLAGVGHAQRTRRRADELLDVIFAAERFYERVARCGVFKAHHVLHEHAFGFALLFYGREDVEQLEERQSPGV